MLRRPTECRVAVLAIVWTVVVLIAGLLVLNDKTQQPSGGIAKLNSIETFDYTSYEARRKHRPVFSVHFDKFSAANGMLGFFNTGLHKVIHIENLKLAFFKYPEKKRRSQDATAFKNSSGLMGGSKPADELLKSFSDFFNECKELQLRFIDISNASQVWIKGFNYNLLDDKNKILSVCSMQAKLLYGQPVLHLRGHVIIEAGNGDILETNIAKWDLQKQTFDVEGGYILTRGKDKNTGKDACFDGKLDFYDKNLTKNSEEAKECLARMF